MMVAYAILMLPLVRRLKAAASDCKQPWLADDADDGSRFFLLWSRSSET